MGYNPLAEELNEIIIKNNKVVFDLLSNRGKAIFFPKKGILGQTAEAKGMAINATIGIALEEDGTPMRMRCVEKSINEIAPQNAFPYAPSYGRPDIREKWKEMIYNKNPGLNGNEISLPVVTNALTHGLSMAGYIFIDEGDEIITPDLYWGNYRLTFVNAYGAKMKTFATFKGTGLNIEGLKESLVSGKNIVILNFPNNPTGYSPTIDESEDIRNALLEAAENGSKIVAFVDDAYFGLGYEEDVYPESIFSKLCNLHENIIAVKLDGATKEDYVWGFRVGFITYGFKGMTKEAGDALASKTAGAIRGNISNASNLSQSIMVKAFQDPNYENQKKEKFGILKRRYEEVRRVINKHHEFSDCFDALPFNSGYFMCLRAKNGIDTEAVRQKLLKDYDTGVITFDDIIRVAFSATQQKDIEKLFENIYNACKEIGG